MLVQEQLNPAREIRAFLIRSAGEAVVIGDDENIFERGIVNSAFSLQLILFLESRFAIEIDTDDLDLENFSSIQAMTVFVDRKLRALA